MKEQVSLKRKLTGIALLVVPVLTVGAISTFWFDKTPLEAQAASKRVQSPKLVLDAPVITGSVGVEAGSRSKTSRFVEPERLSEQARVECVVPADRALRLSQLQSGLDLPDGEGASRAYELGKLHEKLPGEACRALAFSYFQTAAAAEYPRAFAKLANAYRKGLGAPADFGLAIENYKISAELGHASSAYRLIEMVEKGTNDVPRNIDLAREYLRTFLPLIESKVRLGDAIAARSLARIYSNSKLVDRDTSRAIELYRFAADLGDEIAMHDLAMLLLETRRSELRRNDFFPLLLRSSELGYAAAFTAIGRLHLDAEFGFSRNQALRWFEWGIEAGHAGAMEELARLYLEGDIVERDLVKAFEIAKRGAGLKHAGSRQVLEQIVAATAEAGARQ